MRPPFGYDPHVPAQQRFQRQHESAICSTTPALPFSRTFFPNAFSERFFVPTPPSTTTIYSIYHFPQVLALRALNRLFLFVSAKRVVAAVSNSATNTFLSRSPPHFSTNTTPNPLHILQHRISPHGTVPRRNNSRGASHRHLHPAAALAHSSSGEVHCFVAVVVAVLVASASLLICTHLTRFQSRAELIAPLSLHVTCDDDSVRAAVVSTCRVVADADWKQRVGISSTTAAAATTPHRTSVSSSSSLNLRGSTGSSSVRSSFRCEIIRKFASVIGIWGEGCESAPPALTRASVGYDPVL
jgi:hypothetical protein